MGQGRPDRRAVHRAGAARDGAVPQRCRHLFEVYRLKQRGTALVTGRSVGEKIASGPVRVIKSAQFLHQFRDGRSARHRQDRSRLGTDHEEGRGHRHEPRRPHVPCRDCQPRARRAGDRRDRARDGALRDGQSVTVSLRRRRHRVCLRRAAAVRRRARQPESDSAAPARRS